MRLAPLYPILDAEMAAARGHDLIACARGFAGLGIEVQQLRAKTLSGGAFFELAQRLAAVVPTLIVNDRADIARLAGAAGVHVGQLDLPVAAALALAPDTPARWIVGVSTHNAAQVAAAASSGARYLAIGPVFATRSKADPDPVVGLEGVAEARRLYPGPLVAIGGVGLKNAAATRGAGADAVAVISGLWAADDPVEAARRLLLACA